MRAVRAVHESGTLLLGSENLVRRWKQRSSSAGTVRTDIEADAAASLLVTLVIGLLCVVQTGVPLDPATARSAVLSLVAPP
jgi:hypothetical protein